MPFKSEKQRRYLWANEPKIAREWTDRYGAANGGIMQADALNYNPSNMVSVPTEFRARAHSPNTHLAYITDDEAGILQNLKPDTPHRGPMNIPNYDSFDAAGGYSNPDTGYSASSGGGGGGWRDSSAQDRQINRMHEQQRRAHVEKEKIRSSPLHSRYNPNWKMGGAGSNFMGGIGNLLRFINPLTFAASFIDNPIIRSIVSGITQQGGNLKGGLNEFSKHKTLKSYLDRNKNVANNNLGLYTNRMNEIVGPGLRVGEKPTNYNFASTPFDPSQGGIFNTGVADDNLDFINDRVEYADASMFTPSQNALLEQHGYSPAEVGSWSNNEGLNLINSLVDWNTRV